MTKLCPICGGPCELLGKLGQIRHYRCRNCGMLVATGKFGRKAEDPTYKLKGGRDHGEK